MMITMITHTYNIFLKADICQLGVDQRKVNMLAREYCDAAGRKLSHAANRSTFEIKHTYLIIFGKKYDSYYSYRLPDDSHVLTIQQPRRRFVPSVSEGNSSP